MLLGDRGSRWRCLLVWVSGTGALGATTLALLTRARAVSGRPEPTNLPVDLLLVRISAWALLACAGWAWLALTVTVVDARRGAHTGRHGPWRLPSGLRRWVLAACGVALASTLASPADADPAGQSRISHHGLAVLRGLPLPDRAVAPPHAQGRSHPRPAHSHHPGVVVTVQPGDTLWSVAAHDLPADATDPEINARWHAIYAANRRAIGPDPDLLHPGQQLRLPPLPRKDRS